MSIDTAQVISATLPLSLASEFEVRVFAEDRRRAVVRLRGDLDLASAPLLHAVLQNHLDAGLRYVGVDLSGVTFLDCSGLGAIISVQNAVRARSGRLALTGVNARIRRLLRLAGLDTVLEIADPPERVRS